jgi:hypothetical protein
MKRPNVLQVVSFLGWIWIAFSLTYALFGCGDNQSAALLDADVADDVRPDIAMPPDDGGCCRFYPDVAMVRACAAFALPSCTCGVLACVDDVGHYAPVQVCGPINPAVCGAPCDAGVDGGTP